MIKLLIKIFIKNSEQIKDSKVRENYGRLASAVGIGSNLFLFLIKLFTGYFIKSIAVMADSFNNLSDTLSSVITLVGFKLSSRPADEKHPYGHARYEYITALIVSFIILIIGIELVKTSFNKILNPEKTIFNITTVVILVISIAIKLWQSRVNYFIGKKINSTALQATSIDSLNDVFTTTAVLISIILTKLFGWQIDGYIGMGVAVFIVISALKLIKETLNPLIGVAPDNEFVNEIEQKILSYDGILGIHDLVVHNYGPGRCYASVHAEVSANEDILVSHDIIDNIERDFINKMDIHLVIHLDPIITDDEYINELRNLTVQIINQIDGILSMHDFRIVVGATHTNLIFDVVVPPKYSLRDNEIRDLISDKLHEYDERFYAVVTIDRSYISSVNESIQ